MLRCLNQLERFDEGAITLAGIKFASVEASLTDGQAIACVETTLGDSHGMYVVPLSPQGTFRTEAGGRADLYVAGQEVQFYADGDTDVIFEIARNSTRGSGNATVTLAGYYLRARIHSMIV